MKAAWYERMGAARDVLQVGEIDKPSVKPGAVLVRLRATGVNPSDTKRRARRPLPPGIVQLIPHQDGAGVIEQAGEGVAPSRVGQRVWIYEAVVASSTGCAAQYVVVPNENAVDLPDNISFELGACLGVPALTAHRCVFADGPVEGKALLVTGGGGSVGAHAIQFAKAAGAEVFTSVSRPEQAAIAKDAGADFVISRHDGDLAELMQIAAGTPDSPVVDRIVDVSFGETLLSALKLLKQNGVIATYASDAQAQPAIPFYPLIFLGATIRFVDVYAMSREAHSEAIEATAAGLRKGWLKSTIGQTFSLDQIVEAHEAVESGKVVGKVIITID